MIGLVLVLLLVAVATAATVLEVRGDRPRAVPRSRFEDPDLLPASRHI